MVIYKNAMKAVKENLYIPMLRMYVARGPREPKISSNKMCLLIDTQVHFVVDAFLQIPTHFCTHPLCLLTNIYRLS
jgi:hypothetical protein